jgi:hypothetical protein
MTWLSILVPKDIINQIVRDLAFIFVLKVIMNQIVHDLAFHISPQGYHEPNSP